jgi:hypothetical protein
MIRPGLARGRLLERLPALKGVALGATATSGKNILAMPALSGKRALSGKSDKRALSDREALARISGKRLETSEPELARDWRWGDSKVRRGLARWSSAGHIEVKPGLGGRIVITVPEPASVRARSDVGTVATVPEPVAGAPSRRQSQAVATSLVPGPVAASAPEPAASPETETAIVRAPSVFAAPQATGPALRARTTGFVNVLAYAVAVSLAGIAAYFSIRGMIVLFPGAPAAIVVMGVAMEAAKLVTVAFLAHQWRLLGGLSRAVLVTLVAGLAAINAAGVYSQLVAAHFGERVAATSAVETEAAALAARTEVQTQTVADLDRRVGQIDSAIAEMVKRGRTAGALEAIGAQRKVREALVSQRRHEAETLAALKSEAGAVAAKSRQIEVEAAPIMYVAQLLGATTEQAIRLLILLMVLTCDPLALALTAAASRPKAR